MLAKWFRPRIWMPVLIIGIGAISFATSAIVGALAQSPGQIKVQSLVGPMGIAVQTTGPQSAYVLVTGGTFTCSGGTATVTNTNVDAGSAIILTLKTVGGTVAAPFIATITVGTGFTVTCGGSDTSTYNYAIIG
jgi:hypothetical protein